MRLVSETSAFRAEEQCGSKAEEMAASIRIGTLSCRRYDAVIHLVTAAKGAPDFYTVDNNATRTETPEQAIQVDDATRRAWLGATHWRMIGNEGGIDFHTKMNLAVAAICQKLGVPGPAGTRKFFLCRTKLSDVVPVREPLERKEAREGMRGGVAAYFTLL